MLSPPPDIIDGKRKSVRMARLFLNHKNHSGDGGFLEFSLEMQGGIVLPGPAPSAAER